MKGFYLVLLALSVVAISLFTGCSESSPQVVRGAYSRESEPRVPDFPREFRGAWSACIYNIDWPSAKGLSADRQRAQLVGILNTIQSLNMNAIIFQVRPSADAVYRSSLEPWSPWLSGTMGRSPGYDPLQFCIEQARERGIEVHAWFNPFRALPNASMPVSSGHVTRQKPSLIKRYANYKWMDISKAESRQAALKVILDVVRRYDIDGVHLDDYFYPYPKKGAGAFPDGKTPAQRRGYVDDFVQSLYASVKRSKSWVRVGISPFGIWKPGVPAGIEARVSAYDDLAADSRKWLQKGWVDYLMPQLYWRDAPPEQSYSQLLGWWRRQGGRPVWPGIATTRIMSKDDPGRPASEIVNQVDLARTVGGNGDGHAHWSVKGLMRNLDGISTDLKRTVYQQPALVPPMPWASRTLPSVPLATRTESGVQWKTVGVKSVAVQLQKRGQWYAYRVVPALRGQVAIPLEAEVVALRSVDRYGNTSEPVIVR